jgi:hypothetical protein
MTDADTLDTLLNLERQGWDTLCQSTGADFYGSIMSDDGVMVLAHGFVLDRDAVVASLNEAPAWRTYEISDGKLVDGGPDTAILVYTGRAWRDGDEPAFVGLMSSVYVRNGSGWKLALYQQTPIPNAAP